MSLVQVKYNDLSDLLDIKARGFVDTWAYSTGDGFKKYWEFDIVHIKSKCDAHIIISYSKNMDIVITQIWREIEPFTHLISL